MIEDKVQPALADMTFRVLGQVLPVRTTGFRFL